MKPRIIFGALVALFVLNAVAAGQVIDKAKYAEVVKQEFLHAWNNYKKYAWGHDELAPLTKSYHDWYAKSLMLTPVEAYDTMVLMGLKKEAEQDKTFILDSVSFDKDITVSNFEITIRMLGGLLSAYELDGNKGFLKLATDLANRLLPVFNSPTGMPYRFINLKTGETSGDTSNPAEIGTYIVEWGTLSKLTGNPVYFQRAKRAVDALFQRRSPKTGLVGATINVNTGQWVNGESSISGGDDSYYEYLIKGAILFHDLDLGRMWEASVKAVNKYLAQKWHGELWYGRADMNTGVINETYFGALDAFFPAELALGGELKRAEELQNSCYKMWMYYGIEPEEINYKSMKILAPQYYLRPESIESNYYMYEFTHDPKYLCRAATYLKTIIYNCRVKHGFASLSDVRTKQKINDMPSYFLAETLKYLYLTFAPSSVLNFNNVIFNTEAHPMLRDFKVR